MFVDDQFGEDHLQLVEGRHNHLDFIAEKIEGKMREGRKECPEWTTEVPRARVVRGFLYRIRVLT